MNLFIELPDDVAAELQRTPTEIQADVRLALAIDWYRRGMLSQDRAAAAAGLPSHRFRDELATRETGEAPSRPQSAYTDDMDQIAQCLSWTPRERLQHLLDMLAFEERARRARPVAKAE